MKNKELFESIGEHKQIFAVGFDLTDLEDGRQEAEMCSYIEFDGITTTNAMRVIGDILGQFIHGASKEKYIRYAILRTLIMHVLKSMDDDESKPEPEPETETKPKTKPEKPEDDDIRKITDTLGSIKSLLKVIKARKED